MEPRAQLALDALQEIAHHRAGLPAVSQRAGNHDREEHGQPQRRARRGSSPRRTTVLIVSDSLQLTIVYEPGEEGWIIASVSQVPGALSQGRTREEARENVIDALRLLLSPEPGDIAGDREPLRLTIAA
jgi:predicted RNase H-like HicB family nuclease